ncbi:hypothetical protein CPB84DRAFT_1817213 [Gymnopilus junonius]|uniref:Uncharacterized protein n=1 Tax=Gymnopilus junonius TaxID=109634 RepID=A0A9P5NDU6_GYMJU|nr:hypothetical protein CPB84DRAFT_1817213 [Gymnopilus junonius]
MESVFQEAQLLGGQNTRTFYDYCKSHEVAGGVPQPFWTGFPLCDINRAITPDILHQLYQGVLKHLISWCQRILTPEQLDQHICCLPPGYGLERKNMVKILLGCLVGSIPSKGVAAVTALLDFIYIAQYPSHNTETLDLLEDALKCFHKHRDYFIATGVCEDFHIPKFHSLLHYSESIKLFGASNHRDEFPQMICWLSRREKIAKFEEHQMSSQVLNADGPTEQETPPRKTLPISIAKTPNFPGCDLSFIHNKHDVPDFKFYLKQYLNCFMEKPIGQCLLDCTPLSFTKEENDLVKTTSKSSKYPQGCFDTVVVVINDEAETTGLKGIF